MKVLPTTTILVVGYKYLPGCVGSAGCIKDPHTNTYYGLGLTNSLVNYGTITPENYYTGGSRGHSFNVKIICDVIRDNPIFSIYGNIHKGPLFYLFVLKTKLACI